MMTNIDVIITALYESRPLHEMLPKLLNRLNLYELHRGILDCKRVIVEKILKNLKIVVVHRGDEKRSNYKINQGVNPLKYKDNPYIQQFGINVKSDMAMINVCVLSTPKISYHASSQVAILLL